ncbi:MAG: glycosyl transferase family 1 [Legionellales bacterium RIFCSPHIGHO2_12_FULL_35_11]|nr:MAG: glycosyl transferase family 1 [Legionellales bacterium RIFCSPHIGHO2_12_FULL_35_11]
MHIGFDISQTGSNKAGCGFYAYALIQNLLSLADEMHFSLYPSFGDFYFDKFMPIRNQYKSGKYGPRFLTRQQSGNFWNSQDVEKKLQNPDIIHANNFWCPTNLKSSKLIYTFYDMGFLESPNWTTEANRLGCYSGVFRASISADWIVAISEASKQHYLNIFPYFPEDRIRVIYPCSRFNNPDLLGVKPAKLNHVTAGEFWLSVGTIEPRKNQLNLAKAYAQYLEMNGKPMPLVFAGGNGWLMQDFEEQLQKLGIRNQTILTGYVSDAELIWLYRNCYVNLYPSLFEGFGLPVLEGMQFGAATFTSNSSSLPEVAGNAAKQLPPNNIDLWAKEMIGIANNDLLRKKMQEDAILQAERFSWQDSARQLLDLYKEAVLNRPMAFA